MRTFRNTDVHVRVWPSLQRPDGRTLELEPNEEADLLLPSDFEDAHLKQVPRKPKDASPEPPSLKPERDTGSPPDATVKEQES
jgi:hypothetical protein